MDWRGPAMIREGLQKTWEDWEDLRGDWGLQKTYEDWRGPAEIGGFIRPERTGTDRRGDDSGGANGILGKAGLPAKYSIRGLGETSSDRGGLARTGAEMRFMSTWGLMTNALKGHQGTWGAGGL